MAAHTGAGIAAVLFAGTASGIVSDVKTAVARPAAVVFTGSAEWTIHRALSGAGTAAVRFTGSATGQRADTWSRGGKAEVVFNASAGVCMLSNAATVRDAVNAVMALWGQTCGCAGETPEKAEAVGFLNQAVQRLHESGKDYGFVGRVRRTYAGALPVSSVALEDDVQHVDGAVVFRFPASHWLLVFQLPFAVDSNGLAGSDAVVTATGDAPTWTLSTPYVVGDIVQNGGAWNWYRCIQAHTSDFLKQPDDGADWEDYWEPVTKIATGADVAARLAEITGCECELLWDPDAPAIRILRPEASDAAWEDIPFALGDVCTGITWTLSPAQDLTNGGDAAYVSGEKTILRPVNAESALQSVRARFASVVYTGSTLRRPLAYHARAEKSGTHPPAVNLELGPAAEYTDSVGEAAPWELEADVFLEAPRFSCCDVDKGIKLPVPHRYAESLIIPLARYFALSARYRVNESTVKSVKEQAAQALALIGEADPRVKEVQDNRRPSPK